MAKGTGVGFASSVNQSAAAQEKKKRKRADIPVTPEIKQAVAKIRANNHGGKPVKEIQVDHDLLSESWQAIIAVMKECKRPYPMTAPVPVAPVVKAPVVFEEIVATYDDPAAITTVQQAAEVFEPEPDPDAPPHPLPLAIVVVVKRGKAVNTNTPPVIELPAYFGGNFAAEADAARQRVREAHEAETGEKLPERELMDMGLNYIWVRNNEGKPEKRVRQVAS